VRVALDTKFLAYAEGVNGVDMKRTALELVEKLPQSAVLFPVQTGAQGSATARKSAQSDIELAGRLLSD
jgi:predicted nucleic acid-binding protein